MIICLNAQLSYHGNKTREKLKGSCLKQSKITYTHGKIINIYIVFEIKKKFDISTCSTLKNCLFGAVSSTKNAYIVKYKYSGYRIGFQRPWFFSCSSGGAGRNVEIFGVDMSLSTKIDNKKKTLFLGKAPTVGLEHTLFAEKRYSTNFTENKKNLFELAL